LLKCALQKGGQTHYLRMLYLNKAMVASPASLDCSLVSLKESFKNEKTRKIGNVIAMSIFAR
jgi:hypothetical protein